MLLFFSYSCPNLERTLAYYFLVTPIGNFITCNYYYYYIFVVQENLLVNLTEAGFGRRLGGEGEFSFSPASLCLPAPPSLLERIYNGKYSPWVFQIQV